MLLAVVFIAVTLAVVASVVAPLVRKSGPVPARAAFDRGVYRAQLAELERDVARGLIQREEEASARLEIERRLLASAAGTETVAPPSAIGPILAVVLALAIPSVAALVYLARGSPGLPDHPVAEASRQPSPATDANVPGHADFAAAVVRLEQQLKEHPEDTEKWLLLARSQAEIGNWQKSADAYRKVIGQNGADADVYAGYGEMLVMLAQGVVTPAARSAFENGLRQDPSETVARYYLALGDAQSGNVLEAIEAWRKLAADLPADSNMREEIKRRIDQAAQSAGIEAPALPPAAQGAAPDSSQSGKTAPAPTDQDMAAAQSMSPEERLAMIRSMVARLAERLKSEPNDLDGWLRLGRAYSVLGQRSDAIDAYEHADRLLAPESKEHSAIATAITELKGQ